MCATEMKLTEPPMYVAAKAAARGAACGVRRKVAAVSEPRKVPRAPRTKARRRAGGGGSEGVGWRRRSVMARGERERRFV